MEERVAFSRLLRAPGFSVFNFRSGELWMDWLYE